MDGRDTPGSAARGTAHPDMMRASARGLFLFRVVVVVAPRASLSAMGISPPDRICVVALHVSVAVDAVAIVTLSCRAVIVAVVIAIVALGATCKTVVGAAAIVVIVRTLPLRGSIAVGITGVARRQFVVPIPDAPPTFFTAVALLPCAIWRRRAIAHALGCRRRR